MSEIPFDFYLSRSYENQFDITSAVIATGINFSNYVTQSQLTSAIRNINVDAQIYASSLINDVPFLTSHQSLSNYYTKAETALAISAAAPTVTQTITSGTEIGSINGTKLYAPSIQATDLTNYYTKTEADAAFINVSEVSAALNSGTAIATIGSVTLYAPSGGSGNVDLSNYYTKTQADGLFLKISDAGSVNTTCTFG